MAKKLYKEDSDNFFVAIFGFVFDCLKVIFKFSPDKDQSYFEFFMEKFGAIAVILFCIGLFAALIAAALLEQ